MTALIGPILSLVIMIFQEYLSTSARSRAADTKFELNQASLKVIVDAAVIKWSNKNSADSQEIGKAWDEADKNKKGPLG